MPQRIQRKRTKGWRLPEGTIYVGRPTRWGNPFIAGQWLVPPINRYQPTPIFVRDARHAVLLYRRWLTGAAVRCADVVPILGGHDLACWCPLEDRHGNRVPCHADVLLELANQDLEPADLGAAFMSVDGHNRGDVTVVDGGPVITNDPT